MPIDKLAKAGYETAMSDTPEKSENDLEQNELPTDQLELPTDQLEQISGGTDRFPTKIGVPDPRDLRDDDNGGIRGNNGPLRGYMGPSRRG